MDHELRKTGIGGSDVAALFGLSPWKSELELYCDKVGLSESVQTTELMEWGNRLEEVIFKKYMEETGRGGELTSQLFYRHPENKFMFCHPDGLITKNTRQGILEIKNTSVYVAKNWDDGAPDPYMLQLQHNMAVMGLEWGSFAVLMGGNTFKWMDVERNDKIIDVIYNKEKKFWERVEAREPPPADGSNSSKRALSLLFKETAGSSVALPPAATDLDETRLKAIAEIKKWEGLKNQAENQIKELIGSNSYGVLPTGGRYSWKTIARKEHIVKESTSRTLRRLKA